MRRALRGRGFLALACGVVLTTPRTVLALDAAQARGRAEQSIRAIEYDTPKSVGPGRIRYRPPTPAQRVAAGDMLLRTKDFDRAIETLSKVLELRRQGK